MAFDYISWASDTRKMIAKYGTLSNTTDTLLNMIVLYANQNEIQKAENLKQTVEKQLRSVYSSKVSDAVSLPAPENAEGEINLGAIFQGNNTLHDLKIPISDLNRHVAVFASAGHGKTTLLINVMHQLLEHNINFLAFDFKQDFRHLKHLPVIVLRWNWLRINPFVAPEGVDEFHWLSLICDLFAHVYGWFHASKNYLFEFVNDEFQRKKDSFVSLRSVKEDIEGKQEREYERQRMKTVVLNRVSTLVTRLHEVLDCDQGFPISELLKYPLVIEMDDCDPDDASFLTSIFLVYAFEYRKAQRHRGGLEHVIFFDEAHRVFYRQSEYRETEAELGSSIINQIPRIIRDYNEGLIFATQEPSQINNSVMANTDLKFVGYLGNGADIEAMKRAFQLSDEDTAIIKRLERGQFMVQKSGVNEGSPFLLHGFDYPIEKKVSDSELKERMKEFITTMQSEPESSHHSESLHRLPKISEKAAKVLNHVGQFPLRSISQRYKLLNMHPVDGKKAITELASSSMVNMKSIRLSSGRPSVYLEPTDNGLLWLKENKVDVSIWEDYVGHVGLEHRVYQLLIAKGFQSQGYKVEKEYNIGRKRLDIYTEKEECKIGIEICVSPKMNFFEASEAAKQLDEMIFVCRDESVASIMQKELASSEVGNPKFKFLIAWRLISELYSYPSTNENNENNPPNTPNTENNLHANSTDPEGS